MYMCIHTLSSHCNYFYVEFLSSTPIVVNQHNLAYLAALFPESELVREQLLLTRRWRTKQPFSRGFSDSVFNDNALQQGRNSKSFNCLLSTDVISSPKDQLLFLLVLVSVLARNACECLVMPHRRAFMHFLLGLCSNHISFQLPLGAYEQA